jgi:hypothetical protein
MMAERTDYQLWYGRDEPPSAPRPLKAGPVTALLDGRDLRQVCYGGLEVAQRIYIAVRDRNWGTVPGTVSDLIVDEGEDRFAVHFTVTHRQHDIDFVWRGEILGTPDGIISYAMDATAGREMDYKLIGLNVHHGRREYAGRPYRGHSPQGEISGNFPTEVAPQLIADETEVPIFPDVDSLTAQLTDDVAVRFDFEGDTFEFEDQRNWTDASFKSQSYPPRRGGFLHANPGDQIHQKVTLTVSGTPPAAAARPEMVNIALSESTVRRLPPIGFGMASHGRPLSEPEAGLLRALRPEHLRVDLRLNSPGYAAELERAIAACRQLGCGLELAIFVTDNAASELAALAQRLNEVDVPIRRVLVFHNGEQATSERWIALAREQLAHAASDALFAGGTNANFCELNRYRPQPAAGNGIAYAITPQIHAFDERSIAENLAGQAETVITARAFTAGAPVIVSPVTLKKRFNSVATTAEPELQPGELPAQVDPRQMSLFTAGWTAGSVKSLTEAGASSLTYYETSGWRGVIETDAGSSAPELFPSRPGDVFPVYHVFADLAEWQDGELLDIRSDDPLAVEALAMRTDGATHALLANLTPTEQQVHLGPLPDGEVRVRRLDAASAPLAMRDSVTFRATTEPATVANGALDLSVPPFAVVRIDVAPR